MSVQAQKPDRLEKLIENQPLAVDMTDPNRFQMRIARDGTWYHQGTPIRRLALAKLFSTVLRREADGEYWLVTPVERGRIEVEDAPLTVVDMTAEGEGKEQVLCFKTNFDEIVRADADHPLRLAKNAETEEPSPYITVRDNLEALITRSTFYDLVDLAYAQWDGDEGRLGIWSGGGLFELGSTAE